MDKINECKGCRENVHLSREEMEQIFRDITTIRDVKTVTENEYNKRVKICSKCSALEFGTTCKFCGCLIPIKAKLLNAKCPYPFEAKW